MECNTIKLYNTPTQRPTTYSLTSKKKKKKKKEKREKEGKKEKRKTVETKKRRRFSMFFLQKVYLCPFLYSGSLPIE